MNKQLLIKRTYYNPSFGFTSLKKLYEKLKVYGVTMQEIKNFLKEQETFQLHKTAKKPKVFFPITSYYPNQNIQIDIMDVSNVSSANSNYKYLLIGIDIFTRVACAIAMKNKQTDSILEAVEKIINNFKPDITSIQCDNGSEFVSKKFKDLMKDHNIEIHYVDVNEHHKLGIVDRFIRTLRLLIDKYCTAFKTTKYIDALQKIIHNYNNNYHTGIKTTPNDAINKQEEISLLNIKQYNRAKKDEIKFEIGDKVRHIINKNLFDKGSNAKWSKTIYSIINKTQHSYQLSNDKWFKYYELSLAENPQTINIIQTRAKTNLPTKEELKKAATTKRRLNKEQITPHKMLTEKRVRIPTNKFHY